MIRDLAIAVAASALFAVVEKVAFPLGTTGTVVGMVITFIVAIGVASIFSGRLKGIRIASGVRTKGDMTVSLKRADIRRRGDIDIASGNNVSGNADFTIEDVKLGGDKS